MAQGVRVSTVAIALPFGAAAAVLACFALNAFGPGLPHATEYGLSGAVAGSAMIVIAALVRTPSQRD